MNSEINIDEWIRSDLSALVLREYLIPVEGKDSPFFPPTFAGNDSDEDSDYCIDTLKDGTRTCLVDSVGSQANRMEPVFTKEPYDKIIPQIKIKAGEDVINLCEVGHRIADAFLRHSNIFKDIEKAMQDLKNNNALALAKLAPTSLVFGLWDSRGTQVKLPRIISSVIRAYDIDRFSRSAQYFTPVNYRNDELLGEYDNDKKEKEARSSLGFNESPATNTHGGIIAHGDIRKDTVINFAALRKINAGGDTEILQKYILGISLLAALSIKEWDLRQGCLLVRDPERTAEWNMVYPDGNRKEVSIKHDEILKYTQDIARQFGVGKNRNAEFNKDSAKDKLKAKKKGKKK